MAPSIVFQCSSCKAVFSAKGELQVHINKTSPGCKSRPKNRELLLTGRAEGRAVRDRVFPTIVSSRADYHHGTSETFLDDTLVKAMEAGMQLKKKVPRKSGLESSILATIADGDEDMIAEYSRTPIDPVTGTRRISKEIVSTVTRKAKINIDKIASILDRAQNVALCFLLDTTGSMCSYISGVKDQIIEIVEHVEANGCGIEGLAFVGYKDWCDGVDHFEILPFTKSVAEFKTFVASIRATGGGDAPEDVLGGLEKAVTLSWPHRSGIRIIFHLGDAPPHGKGTYHDHTDSYKDGHPNDPPLQQLFDLMRSKEVSYFFGRINAECEKMISVFEKFYGQKIDQLDSTKVSTICSSVVESVSISLSVTYRTRAILPSGKNEIRMFTIDEKEPDWSLLPRLDGTILTFELPESINDITSFSKLEDKIKKCRLQIAPNPFAKGSVRLAYYGKIVYVSPKDNASALVVDDVVFKEMISPPKIVDLDRQRYITDLEVQTVAAFLAFEFNGKLGRTTENPNVKLKFLMSKVVRIFKSNEGEGTAASPRFLAYEQRFRADSSPMIKYTNNSDFVLDPKTLDENGRKRLELAVAFSHFSHDVTDGYLLVCDLQGVDFVDARGKETLLLTDPAIHCAKHLRFGKTNISSVGIARFFKKHVCNKYCKALGLKKF